LIRKHILCLVLAFSLFFILAGCGIFEQTYELTINYYPIEDTQNSPSKSIAKHPDKFEVMKENMGEFKRISLRLNKDYDVRDIDTSKPNHKKFEKYGKFKPISKRDSFLNLAVVEPYDTKNIDWKEMIEYYDSLPEVMYAEPDYKIYLQSITPDDPLYPNQWHYQEGYLNMPHAWDIEMGEPFVKVAIIDTGIAYMEDPDKPGSARATDLADCQFDYDNAWDYIEGDSIAIDDQHHGTHVAGTIAQTINNGFGGAGMAPYVTLLSYKVFASDGSAAADFAISLADAIERATDAGSHAINMSLRMAGYEQVVYDACKYAYDNGVTVFAASGNGFMGIAQSEVTFPAGYEHVIAVGSTNVDKEKSYYSNYGLGDGVENFGLDVVAPGGETVDYEENGVLQQTINASDNPSDYYGFDFYYFQGTSMATPHAVGLAALMKSHNPLATPADIEQVMKETAEDLGDPGLDDYFGYGLINPLQALIEIKKLGPAMTEKIINDAFEKGEEYNQYYIPIAGSDFSMTFTPDNGKIKVSLINPDGEVLTSSNNGTLEYFLEDKSGTYTIKVEKSN
jgi:serine protease